MRRIAALLTGIVAMTAVAGASLPTSGNEAQAHVRCTGGSHWHQHGFHRDHWVDKGTYTRNGRVIRQYYISQDGGRWEVKTCT